MLDATLLSNIAAPHSGTLNAPRNECCEGRFTVIAGQPLRRTRDASRNSLLRRFQV